jgi:Arylsulfatase A and related enzymes
MGRVLKALDTSPYRDNTVVIYLTDHGRGLLREKRWCYDAGLHLSMLVRAPGITTSGSVDAQLISWVDLAPTILSLAGLDIPDHYQGQVFLGPGKASARTYVFGGRDRMDESFDYCRCVRNKSYHYIRNEFPEIPYAQEMWYQEIMETVQVARKMAIEGTLNQTQSLWFQESKPYEELYDVKADPEMVVNLADAPEFSSVKEDLKTALERNLDRWGDLGKEPEQNLIDRGLVADSLTRMRQVALDPPTGKRRGAVPTIVEMPALAKHRR